ncbi:protein TonB [Chitinivorax tropicus]|uniref:Protein TonB n=1 Tax=Chitinivorax tropicus TaxID=714531 RepID=A0A840MSG5_9PROT|nr:protein TonB [Chitinivorax tropicus]
MNRNPNLISSGVAIALHIAVIGALVVNRPSVETAPRLDYVEMISAVAAPAEPAPATPPKPSTPEPSPTKPAPVRQAVVTRPMLTNDKSATEQAPTASATETVSEPQPTLVAAAHPAPVTPTSVEKPAPAVETQPVFSAAYLSNPKPAYPPLSLELQEQGTVMVRAQVSEKGLPISVEVSSSSGFPRLDKAALEAVRRWKFVPAKRGEEPIVGSVLIPLKFNLYQA